MVVDEAGGLHEGVAGGRTDEFEAFFLEGFAHFFGDFGLGGDFAEGSPFVLDRFVVHEFPDEFGEAAGRIFARLMFCGRPCGLGVGFFAGVRPGVCKFFSAVFFLDFQKSFGIGDDRLDFEAMADYSGILH